MSSVDGSQPPMWRSLEELAQTEEFAQFVEREFPGLAHDMPEAVSRREFLTLMGASAMMAGLASCRWPEEVIAPHAVRPEGRLPGVPVHYATAMELDGVARGLLVTSYDGRPIKIEGNPEHPQECGGAALHAQASILDLYDPARTHVPRHRGKDKTWQEFFNSFRETVSSLPGGKGLHVLAEPTGSPVAAMVRTEFLAAFPSAQWHEYTSISRDLELEGAATAFGEPYRVSMNLDKARVIVSIDADLLMSHPAAVRMARKFADHRVPENGLNRLYMIECGFSVTGSNADHRLAIAPSRLPWFCLFLARELKRLGVSLPGDFDETERIPTEWSMIPPMARDLVFHGRESIVAVGSRQPAEIHALAHAINAGLGAVGHSVVYHREPQATARGVLQDIADLAKSMRAGEVKALLILGGNPIHAAPADHDFARLLDSVPFAAHLAMTANETAMRCEWHLPQAHYLETWSDAVAWDGTYSVIQPLIAPLYEGRSATEVVGEIVQSQPVSAMERVRQSFDRVSGNAGDAAWHGTLRDGFLEDSTWPIEEPELQAPAIAEVVARLHEHTPARGLEAIFAPDYKLHDGRFANNAWLQELPDPITKVVWDNPALLSLGTAERLGVRHAEIIDLSIGGRRLQIPAFIVPGIADGTVVLSLGYGRTSAGQVGNGVGWRVEELRTSDAYCTASIDSISGTGRQGSVVTTQDHFAIDNIGMKEREKRSLQLVREMAAAALAVEHGHDDQAEVHHGPPPLFSPPTGEPEHKWAMTVDLSRCIGCNACVVACQAENNIPIVGKREVRKGREMHWIRVDRYFRGDPHRPRAAHQPIMCQHCDNAPCEQVCPVAATMQNADGLNVMVYNRCVGTRYCANNCPWKVRRFNYFNLNLDVSETEKMQKNPDVTVRARGVMEKCTYCVQRIERAKIKARNESRQLVDGEVMPACAQSCPAKAILFGDLLDPKSRVAALQHHDPRDYETLEELGNKSRTRYLARVHNPNPEIEEATA